MKHMGLYGRRTLNDLMSSERFRERLLKLNQICASVGEYYGVTDKNAFVIEGGLMYYHTKQYNVTDGPDPIRTAKINNYLLATSQAKTFLEIGINAGHSLLLALSANEDLTVHANDICHHHYTRACVEFLKAEFGERLQFHPGDSREIVPLLATHRRLTFDVLHVDGGHGADLCRVDIANCLRLAHSHSLLLLDDTSAPHVRDVYVEFAAMGYLTTEMLGGAFDQADQLLARIHP